MEDDTDSCSNSASPRKPHSSNIASDQIDQETADKLRGDAIGDTMYSEVFVLNTLLQFSDLKWGKEVEDNLCFLWDMTEEKDVCMYLFEVTYPSLACTAIMKYNEPRFIEIVVGILANLMCAKCEKKIKEEEIKIVLNLLNSDNPYILIQVMRFIHAVSFMFDKLRFIEEQHLSKFGFILENSANKELLAITLKTLSAITDSTKLDEDILHGELVVPAVTAYRTLIDDCDDDIFEKEEQHINLKHLIQIVCNLCCYVDLHKNEILVGQIKLHLEQFVDEIVPLLNFYRIEDNLVSSNDSFKYYIEALTYIFRVLNVEYISSVAKALSEVYIVMSRHNVDSLDSVAELLCYFVSVGDPDSVKKDCELATLLGTVLADIETRLYSFDFEYENNLRKFLDVL